MRACRAQFAKYLCQLKIFRKKDVVEKHERHIHCPAEFFLSHTVLEITKQKCHYPRHFQNCIRYIQQATTIF